MPRYKIIIEYDGNGLVGWQAQNNGLSIQSLLQEAIYKFSGENVEVYGAGRTDAGVHALAQVAHFDMKREFENTRIRDAMNAHLRHQAVVILDAEKTSPDFHARFSAIWRSYIYRITNRRSPLALDKGKSWWIPIALNEENMNDAAKILIGKHDFTSFRASECQAKSPIRTIEELKVIRQGSEIRVHVKARSFLHHMVRNIVGTLKLVGDGKWTPEDVKLALEAKDRRAAGPTAPAMGLYLSGVGYSEGFLQEISDDDFSA